MAAPNQGVAIFLAGIYWYLRTKGKDPCISLLLFYVVLLQHERSIVLETSHQTSFEMEQRLHGPQMMFR